MSKTIHSVTVRERSEAAEIENTPAEMHSPHRIAASRGDRMAIGASGDRRAGDWKSERSRAVELRAVEIASGPARAAESE